MLTQTQDLMPKFESAPSFLSYYYDQHGVLQAQKGSSFYYFFLILFLDFQKMQTVAVLSVIGDCRERSALQHQGTLSARGSHLQASSTAASYPQCLPSLADSLSCF